MAQIRVFSSTLKGFVEYTRNTLGITTVTSSAPIAINALLQATPAPPGGTLRTLSNWTNASASAFLTGLPGNTVVKAYLAWYGQPTPDVNGSLAATIKGQEYLDFMLYITHISVVIIIRYLITLS